IVYIVAGGIAMNYEKQLPPVIWAILLIIAAPAGFVTVIFFIILVFYGPREVYETYTTEKLLLDIQDREDKYLEDKRGDLVVKPKEQPTTEREGLEAHGLLALAYEKLVAAERFVNSMNNDNYSSKEHSVRIELSEAINAITKAANLDPSAIFVQKDG